jgi:hypothetical protein
MELVLMAQERNHRIIQSFHTKAHATLIQVLLEKEIILSQAV